MLTQKNGKVVYVDPFWFYLLAAGFIVLVVGLFLAVFIGLPLVVWWLFNSAMNYFFEWPMLESAFLSWLVGFVLCWLTGLFKVNSRPAKRVAEVRNRITFKPRRRNV